MQIICGLETLDKVKTGYTFNNKEDFEEWFSEVYKKAHGVKTVAIKFNCLGEEYK